jgi:pimeloyl-ACP methyl ester carboxylesterase
MATATLGGLRTHYYRRGTDRGPTVVLVHGLATSAAFWFPHIVPALARDHLVLAYDLRGHGRSGMPVAGYGTADLVADLHGLLRHEGIGTAHLVGHSYGGAVALHHAVLHPEQVASLTIADTRLGAFQPDAGWLEWLGLDAGRTKQEQVMALAEGNGRATGSAGRDGPDARTPPGVASARTAIRWRRLLEDTNAAAELRGAPGPAVVQLRRVHVPVLAAYGEHSKFLPSCRGLQRYLPRCRSVVVPGAGHFHPRSKPQYFVHELCGFLSGVAADSEEGRP